GENEAPVPVRLVYARPLSNRSGEVSIMELKGSKELAWIEALDLLSPEAKDCVVTELKRRYQIAQVIEVPESMVNHGHRYVRVLTDRGERYFNLKEPGKNVSWLSTDHLIIRDSMGNRYEVPSLQALDQESRQRLLLVL